MGGTTAKVGIVRDGKPAVTNDFQVGRQGQLRRHPRRHGIPGEDPRPSTSPRSGPAAAASPWVDRGGALRVGPRSAGSMPGPACYGRGGTEPTVTDANLLLGYLDPGGLAGGVTSRSKPRPTRSTRGRRAPLDIDLVAAAHADPRHRQRQHGGRDPGGHRPARASTPATSLSSRSVAPGQCTPSRSPRCSGSLRAVTVRGRGGVRGRADHRRPRRGPGGDQHPGPARARPVRAERGVPRARGTVPRPTSPKQGRRRSPGRSTCATSVRPTSSGCRLRVASSGRRRWTSS